MKNSNVDAGREVEKEAMKKTKVVKYRVDPEQGAAAFITMRKLITISLG